MVICSHCGHEFETNSPFPKTTCPVCHNKTDVKKIEAEIPAA